MMERLQSYKVICEGGLDSNQNFLQLGERSPGAATYLLNFEPSLFGGYRRLEGFAPLEVEFPEVDAVGSEGKILGISIFGDTIIVGRKTKSASTYKLFFWTDSGDWTPYTTGLTQTATGINRFRSDDYNFDGTDHICFVDGVNNAALFDGTNWSFIDSADSGIDFAHAGGNQALDKPKFVSEFKNHLFVSGDEQYPNIVAHSAPNADFDWLVASGAGQLNVGFKVKQIKPFRDELYVYGETKIKKIVVEGTTFVVKDVAKRIGCLAPDSVIEMNGDLIFLAQDGFRTVAATQRNDDVELGVLSKSIQQDVTDLMNGQDFDTITGVAIRKKSQIRFFFSDENLDTFRNPGVIAGLKAGQNGVYWEWGLLRGIRASCVASAYIGAEEYVIHGDYNGKVYRQEVGNSFDGQDILAIYTTPYFDMGDVNIRKTMHKATVFLKPEGETVISVNFQYNWDSRTVFNPTTYLLEQNVTGSVYGQAVYNESFYASAPVPVLVENIEGGGESVKMTFSTSDQNSSYSIQGIVLEYAINGRK